MADSTQVSGKTTTCMGGVFITGRTVELTKENIFKTSSMALEFTRGRIVGDMKVVGGRVNNMDRELIRSQARRQKLAFGTRG